MAKLRTALLLPVLALTLAAYGQALGAQESWLSYFGRHADKMKADRELKAAEDAFMKSAKTAIVLGNASAKDWTLVFPANARTADNEVEKGTLDVYTLNNYNFTHENSSELKAKHDTYSIKPGATVVLSPHHPTKYFGAAWDGFRRTIQLQDGNGKYVAFLLDRSHPKEAVTFTYDYDHRNVKGAVLQPNFTKGLNFLEITKDAF